MRQLTGLFFWSLACAIGVSSAGSKVPCDGASELCAWAAPPAVPEGSSLTAGLEIFPLDIRDSDIFFDFIGSVGNNGSGTVSVDVEFILSSDSMAGGNDPEFVIAGQSISSLAPGQLATVPQTVFAPDEPRLLFFYLRATPTGGPNAKGSSVNSPVQRVVLVADLVTATPIVNPTTLASNSVLTAQTTVSNTGIVSNSPQPLQFYLSDNQIISDADSPLGDPITINRLSSIPINGQNLQSQTVSLMTNLNVPAGEYFVGACVAVDPKEGNANNNCSTGVSIMVENAGQADLTVESATASATTVEAGGTTELSVSVRNVGDGAAPASTLRYYRSDNPTISTSDTLLTTNPVGSLGAGEASMQSAVLSVPLDPGNYWFGACIENAGEPNTANDCSDGVMVGVIPSDASANRTLMPLLAVDPARACPGFYIGKVTALGSQGRWSMEILLDPNQRPLLQGGLNLGGGFGDSNQPGFAAFNIANPTGEVQLVDLSVDVQKPDAMSYRVEIVRRQTNLQTIVASSTFTSSSATMRAELSPGFYSARIFATGNAIAPATYNMMLATSFSGRAGGAFQGGVNLGGVMTSGSTFGTEEGFGALCIDRQQAVSFETFGNDAFGAQGVSNLQLQVLDRNRNVVDQAPSP